jgi:hypothetical protein
MAHARMSTLKGAALFAILVAAFGSFLLPRAVWQKTAGDTTCDEWIQQMTPDQRSGLAKGYLLLDFNGKHPELAVQTQGDHVSGLLAGAITSVCNDAISYALSSPGWDWASTSHGGRFRRISDIAQMSLTVKSGYPPMTQIIEPA